MLSSTVTSSASSAVSMTTAVGLGTGGALIAVYLILLLCSKELLLASPRDDSWLLASLNAAILPLLVVFAMTVLYNALGILGGL